MPSVHEAQPHLQMLETLLDAWEKLEVLRPWIEQLNNVKESLPNTLCLSRIT